MTLLNKLIANFPEEIMNTFPTLTGDHLFEVLPDKERNIFDKETVTACHHSVAQLIFGTQRVRKDIQTSVNFLTTRLREPDEDDWSKLQRILQYLRRKIYITFILRSESLNVIATVRRPSRDL